MIDGLYVHLLQKRAMYGIDPAQRLRLLRHRLGADDGPAVPRGAPADLHRASRPAHQLHSSPPLPGTVRLPGHPARAALGERRAALDGVEGLRCPDRRSSSRRRRGGDALERIAHRPGRRAQRRAGGGQQPRRPDGSRRREHDAPGYRHVATAGRRLGRPALQRRRLGLRDTHPLARVRRHRRFPEGDQRWRRHRARGRRSACLASDRPGPAHRAGPGRQEEDVRARRRRGRAPAGSGRGAQPVAAPASSRQRGRRSRPARSRRRTARSGTCASSPSPGAAPPGHR